MKRASLVFALVLFTAILPALAQSSSKPPAKPEPAAQADTAGGCPVETVDQPSTETNSSWQEKSEPVLEVFGIVFLIVCFLMALCIPLGLVVSAVVLCRRAAERQHAWRAERRNPAPACVEISYPEGAYCEWKRAA